MPVVKTPFIHRQPYMDRADTADFAKKYARDEEQKKKL